MNGLILITLLVVLNQVNCNPSVKSQTESRKLSINLKECKSLTQTIYNKFGSDRFTVKGRKDDACTLQIKSETEGAYETKEFVLPVNIGKLDITQQCKQNSKNKTNDCKIIYSKDISKYGAIVKSGNGLQEIRKN